MLTRSGGLSGLFVILAVGVWGCGRTALLPRPDGGTPRGDATAPDSAPPDLPTDQSIRSPDGSPDRNADLPSGPRVDASPDLRADALPDTAADRSPDLASDRAREAGTTAPDRFPDGPANDRAFDSTRLGPEAPPPGLSVLAGMLAGPGGVDGIGPSAQFYFPAGAALDGAGSLYIADSANNTIRKMVLATSEVSTVAGLMGEYGSADGVGASARFYSPQGLAADGAGNLYIADSANHTLRKMVLASGQVTTIAGAAGQSGHQDARGGAARFQAPTALALDGAGNLYLSDLDNTIRRMVLATGEVTTVAGEPEVEGDQDGRGEAAHFRQPRGLAADSAGNLYVADTDNCTIRRIVLATGTVTTIAGLSGSWGEDEGIGSAARFSGPQGLALDGKGNLYVATHNGRPIRKLDLATAAVTNLPSSPEWQSPSYLAYDGAGNLFVTDSDRHTVTRLSLATQTVVTIAGRAIIQGGGDGVGADATFFGPSSLVSDHQGGLFVANSYWNSIRKIDVASGRVTTLAGSLEGASDSGDGTGTAARFASPSALAYDGQGTLYVADMNNNTVRKMVLETGVVTTLAGNPNSNDSRDGKGTSAHFFAPSGLALDGEGNLLVAERAGQVIRKIVLADTTVTTLAGTASSWGPADGLGAQARFNSPSGLVCDGAGNLYVADTGNCTIRQIVIATGRTTTLAGHADACEGVDGIASGAHFQEPVALAMDPAGRLLVADSLDDTVRRIDLSSKQVTTIVGHSGRWQTVPGPLPAYVSRPSGLAVLPSGDLAISDVYEDVILLARF